MKIRAASVVWSVLSILFGWTFFAWSWFDVLGDNDSRIVINSVALLAVMTVVFLLATLLWISHNQRLARHGKRGLASAVRVPNFDRDRVDRLYVLPARDDLQSASILNVDVTDGQKVFTTSSVISSNPA